MRKSVFVLGLLALVISCSKEQEAETPSNNASEPYQITVNPSTRTVFNPADKTVTWETTDELSVLITANGKTTGHKFVCKGGDTFECTTDFTPKDGVGYTFDVVYPYSSHATSIDKTGYTDAYFPLPCRDDKTLGQAKFNDASHVKGVMYGKANISGSDKPSIALHQAAEIFTLTLKNVSAADIKVQQVEMTAPASQSLSGSFHVNTSDGSLKPATGTNGQQYAKNAITVTLTDGFLSAGSEGVVYIPTPEFSLKHGETLTFTVTDDKGGKYTLTKTAKKDLTFAKGTVNKMSMELNEAAAYTSNVTGTISGKGSDCTVKINGSSDKVKGWKLGNSNKPGTLSFTIPAGTKSLSFYAYGWSGKKVVTAKITIGTTKYSKSLSNNSGFSGNSTIFNLSGVSQADKLTFDFEPVAEETKVSIASPEKGERRILVFAINAK